MESHNLEVKLSSFCQVIGEQVVTMIFDQIGLGHRPSTPPFDPPLPHCTFARYGLPFSPVYAPVPSCDAFKLEGVNHGGTFAIGGLH
jgi:hypothetical protein